MNVWKCGGRGCPAIVTGLGAPAIRCPNHYADPDESIERDELLRRLENIREHTIALQDEIYTDLDRLFLKKKANPLFVPLRKFRR